MSGPKAMKLIVLLFIATLRGGLLDPFLREYKVIGISDLFKVPV